MTTTQSPTPAERSNFARDTRRELVRAGASSEEAGLIINRARPGQVKSALELTETLLNYFSDEEPDQAAWLATECLLWGMIFNRNLPYHLEQMMVQAFEVSFQVPKRTIYQMALIEGALEILNSGIYRHINPHRTP